MALPGGARGASCARPGGRGATSEPRYLPGAQITNADGIAEITTIYPGCGDAIFSNRTVMTTSRTATATSG